MSSNCLNVNIGLRESVIAVNVELANKPLKAVATTPQLLSVDVRLKEPILRLSVRNAGKELFVRSQNVCGVDFSWDSVADSEGVALFDADNERLLIEK